MYALKSNFYPAQEPKAGYIGKADIAIGNAVRLNNISVFKNEQDGTYSIAFAKFGKDNDRSYVIPSSKEAFAAMVAVVSKAVEAEKHFAFEKGQRFRILTLLESGHRNEAGNSDDSSPSSFLLLVSSLGFHRKDPVFFL